MASEEERKKYSCYCWPLKIVALVGEIQNFSVFSIRSSLGTEGQLSLGKEFDRRLKLIFKLILDSVCVCPEFPVRGYAKRRTACTHAR